MGDSISRRRRRIAGGLALAAAALVLALTLPDPALMRVVQPRPGAVVGHAGVEVMVRYPDGARVAPETLRVLLNGADMTDSITAGSNGAWGRLHGVLDGENVLRVEVFGSRWWLPGVLLEEAREVRFLVRGPQHLNRG